MAHVIGEFIYSITPAIVYGTIFNSHCCLIRAVTRLSSVVRRLSSGTHFSGLSHDTG